MEKNIIFVYSFINGSVIYRGITTDGKVLYSGCFADVRGYYEDVLDSILETIRKDGYNVMSFINNN